MREIRAQVRSRDDRRRCDTAATVEELGFPGKLSHVSTGGGASLEMLEGKQFESVGWLEEA